MVPKTGTEPVQRLTCASLTFVLYIDTDGRIGKLLLTICELGLRPVSCVNSGSYVWLVLDNKRNRSFS